MEAAAEEEGGGPKAPSSGAAAFLKPASAAAHDATAAAVKDPSMPSASFPSSESRSVGAMVATPMPPPADAERADCGPAPPGGFEAPPGGREAEAEASISARLWRVCSRSSGSVSMVERAASALRRRASRYAPTACQGGKRQQQFILFSRQESEAASALW